MDYDKIIIGAGIYGLYAAETCGRKGEKVLVLEYDDDCFERATYINQARVHMGYHYPRSYSTATKSAGYFERFCEECNFCIHDEFKKIYAISSNFSWTSGKQFEKFCKDSNIACEKINHNKYFNEGMCDGAFETKEFTYDAMILKADVKSKLEKYNNVEIRYSTRIESINKLDDAYEIYLSSGEKVSTAFLINATYASVNQVLSMLDYEPFKIKYELCEIILCKVDDKLKDIGITVMDGPFFSIMPFGKTGYHSLTSVTFTPHITSYEVLPTFDCQKTSGGYCSPKQLGNCNMCPSKPKSSWVYMSSLAKKYLKEDLKFEYVESLFSMKPILMASEIDDSRPTLIRKFSEKPTFISVLSGKINTVYDLDEVLK
ncbi:MAG: FAD-dependent oxidoreductase [Clostridium sp.]|uniref:NAD(P)-binding protein n=1 Tax=Clostridium sp. TaxID=1506 RepID=UPI00303BC94D